jgi:hypothetical protein
MSKVQSLTVRSFALMTAILSALLYVVYVQGCGTLIWNYALQFLLACA